MGLSVFPPAGGGGIKSVQRGLASSAGTVTITAVDIAKSFVTVFGTASSGTVAISGNANSSSSNLPGIGYQNRGEGNNAGNIVLTASGGSNNLVTAVVQGYLSNSTSLVVSGACRWEVVEFA